jgi:hypothetical protein
MTGRYRYIDFQRSLGGGAAAVSARLLSQEPERDAAGRIVRLRTARPSFTPREIARLSQPYVSQRFLDQFKTVAPLAAYLVLFQLLGGSYDLPGAEDRSRRGSDAPAVARLIGIRHFWRIS